MAKITKSDAAPEDLIGVFIGNSSFNFTEADEFTENDPAVLEDARKHEFLTVTEDVPADEAAPATKDEPAPAEDKVEVAPVTFTGFNTEGTK